MFYIYKIKMPKILGNKRKHSDSVQRILDSESIAKFVTKMVKNNDIRKKNSKFMFLGYKENYFLRYEFTEYDAYALNQVCFGNFSLMKYINGLYDYLLERYPQSSFELSMIKQFIDNYNADISNKKL